MIKQFDTKFDRHLRTTLGDSPRPDFETWKHRNHAALSQLGSADTMRIGQRRRMWQRIASIAAVLLLFTSFVVFFSGNGKESFAQTIDASKERIRKADMVSWKLTTVFREHSVDRQRTWLRTNHVKYAFLAPSYFRKSVYDKTGNISHIEIFDSSSGKTLRLNRKNKKAEWTTSTQFEPGFRPFDDVFLALKNGRVELLGTKQYLGKPANVFRHVWTTSFDKTTITMDYWIDAQSKRLVRVIDPKIENPSDQNAPSEPRISFGEILGIEYSEIVLDATLNRSDFELIAPPGFEVVESPWEKRPVISEPELVEWLGVSARFNDGQFPEGAEGVDTAKVQRASTKEASVRSAIESEYLDLARKHALNGNGVTVIGNFSERGTVSGSFRYIGKGARLGDKDRIVCWYQLIGESTYRAIYADLSVRRVTQDELPLPVD